MGNGSKKQEISMMRNTIQDIKVSVVVTAYNVEDYIEESLESILCQQTNFNFEIVIGEDAGTDDTIHICRKYAEKYPDIIRLFDYSKNYGSSRNRGRVLKEAKGKYVAICDSDDYWINPTKLQKQFDALEENPEINLSICNSHRLVNHERRPYGKMTLFDGQLIKFEDWLSAPIRLGHTSSFFFRRNFEMDFEKDFKGILTGVDFLLASVAAQGRDIHYIPEHMCIFRSHGSFGHDPDDQKPHVSRGQHDKKYQKKLAITFGRIDKMYKYKYTKFLRKGLKRRNVTRFENSFTSCSHIVPALFYWLIMLLKQKDSVFTFRDLLWRLKSKIYEIRN